MAQLLEKLTDDLNQALKGRDEVKVSTLRLLIAALGNARIAKRADLTDEEILAQIGKGAKQHRESIDAYSRANREDLVSREEAELAILQTYLPQAMPAQIEKVVDEVIASTGAKGPADIGKVMSEVMAKLKESGGIVDGGVVSRIAKGKLTK